MRKVATALFAAAMVLPLALVAAPAGSVESAASKPACKTLAGSETFSPALPKLSSPAKVKPTVTIKANLGGCTGAGIVSGALTARLKFGIASNCTTLAMGASTNTRGTATIVWNTKASTTAAVTSRAVAGKPTAQVVAGPVTAGLFKGSRLSVTTVFVAPKAGCTSSGLAKVTISQATALKIA